MKLSLNCIILFCQDIESLKAFYTDNFNVELMEEIASEWVLLNAGNCSIGLHKIGEAYRLAAGEAFRANANSKLVFETDSDIFKVRECLVEKHVLVGEIKTFENYGYWLCDGEDPEGNVFQLKQMIERI